MKKLFIAIAMALIVGMLPVALFHKLELAYIVIVIVLILGSAFLGIVTWVGGDFIRRRRIANNPLDPSLRRLVASDISWDNCAQAPRFCSDALSSFQFLVEEEGFKPARMDPNVRVLSFRRDDVVVNVGEGPGPKGSQPILEIVLTRSSSSFRAIATAAFGGDTDELGEGFRGAAFFIRAQLDSIIAQLRDTATTPPSAA